MESLNRCWDTDNQFYINYHDNEWGVPTTDDRTLFEFLILEGAQAGLSWETILNKREAYRAAYKGFDPKTVASFGDEDVSRLLADSGIVRNRRKIASSIRNARCFLDIQEEFGSFSKFIWQFVGGNPINHACSSIEGVPVFTPEAERMSAELKRRGFSFVGPTICYSFMQAVGMVNDHLTYCFRYNEIRTQFHDFKAF
ncbi:DNA-3-methyladenine glycosylase I [archaeon]|nr:MAG: DNA-3-methyladenine glycosylase I [archaeon]